MGRFSGPLAAENIPASQFARLAHDARQLSPDDETLFTALLHPLCLSDSYFNRLGRILHSQFFSVRHTYTTHLLRYCNSLFLIASLPIILCNVPDECLLCTGHKVPPQ